MDYAQHFLKYTFYTEIFKQTYKEKYAYIHMHREKYIYTYECTHAYAHIDTYTPCICVCADYFFSIHLRMLFLFSRFLYSPNSTLSYSCVHTRIHMCTCGYLCEGDWVRVYSLCVLIRMYLFVFIYTFSNSSTPISRKLTLYPLVTIAVRWHELTRETF